MNPSQRSLELAQVALQSAQSACGSGSSGDKHLDELANEYQTAERELGKLSEELYGS